MKQALKIAELPSSNGKGSSFSSCPVDIVSAIVSYVDGEAILFLLLMTGDKRLIASVERSTYVNLEIRVSREYRWRWPISIVKRFTNATTVQLGHTDRYRYDEVGRLSGCDYSVLL
jgi:hypothetical protein